MECTYNRQRDDYHPHVHFIVSNSAAAEEMVNGWLRMWPGTARAKFLPAIMPGLPAAEFAGRLRSANETETTRLIAHAVAEGIARPLDAEFRTRLAAATQAAGG